MSARKWIVRVVVLVVLGAMAAGALTGCESLDGGGAVGTDGHAGHNH